MNNVVEAWKRGKETRAKQDEAIALFIHNIRNIEDMELLEAIKKELKGEVK